MSTLVMSLCWPLQMPPTPKAVLVSLADNANDQGVAWPSLTKICERTCFGRTAVIAAIRWLEDEGLVVADRSNGRHTSYTVDLNAVNQFASRTSTPAEPVRLANPNQSASRTNQSASRTIPVREADTNRHKPSRTVKSNRQGKSLAAAIGLLPGLPAELVADFVAVRQ
uniref:helix-turn-helix domain-containing protein n=1 Tax=Stenotrophomonas sp. TaxID=69392 RepID=UPI0028AE1CE1